MPEPKYAVAKLEELSGVKGFNLYFGNQNYGHYPIDDGHDAEAQIKMALGDADDYGFSGIIFQK